MHRCQQTADTDADCAEIGSFINFKEGIHFPPCFNDFLSLIGSYGIKPASEARQLNKGKGIAACCKLRCAVEPVVVYPLIDNTQGTRQFSEVSDGIFG